MKLHAHLQNKKKLAQLGLQSS